MTALHTPGPWRNVQDGSGDPQAIYAADGSIVAEYVRSPADAALIAGTLDLLAACVESLNLLTDPDAGSFEADRVTTVLAAAIAKVTP